MGWFGFWGPFSYPLFCGAVPIPWYVGSLWSCCLHSCSSSTALWKQDDDSISFVLMTCFSRGICTWIGQNPWTLKWFEANIQQYLKGYYRKRLVLLSSLIWCESLNMSQTWLVLPHTQAFCRIAWKIANASLNLWFLIWWWWWWWWILLRIC